MVINYINASDSTDLSKRSSELQQEGYKIVSVGIDNGVFYIFYWDKDRS